MMKVKWTLQWLFVSIILGLDYLQKISANEQAVTHLPALECYDPYGKPQVNILTFTGRIFNFYHIRYAMQAQNLYAENAYSHISHASFNLHKIFQERNIDTFTSIFTCARIFRSNFCE